MRSEIHGFGTGLGFFDGGKVGANSTRAAPDDGLKPRSYAGCICGSSCSVWVAGRATMSTVRTVMSSVWP